MKKFLNSCLFLFVVFISLFLPMSGTIQPGLKLLLITAAWGIGIYFYFKSISVFVPLLFLLINTVLGPLSSYLIQILSLNIPQIYFLLSILVYLFIVFRIKKFKVQITWLKPGKFDRLTVLLILIMTILTGIALFLWAFLIKKDLSEFRKFIPDIPFLLLILYGILFPVLNSLFEEFMARAIIFDGFSALFQNIIIVIIGQAIVFSIWHYNGFPGGISGVILVFIWSIFLGTIRYRAKGMLPPLLAHFFADLSIAIILLFSVVL